jgi:hypothetical protein
LARQGTIISIQFANLKTRSQPIVEAAHFEDRNELVVMLQPISGQLLKEGLDLLRVRRDLPSQHHIAVVVAERDGNLARVLIDSKVQHDRGPPVGKSDGHLSLCDRTTAQFQQGRLFHRYQSADQRNSWHDE